MTLLSLDTGPFVFWTQYSLGGRGNNRTSPLLKMFPCSIAMNADSLSSFESLIVILLDPLLTIIPVRDAGGRICLVLLDTPLGQSQFAGKNIGFKAAIEPDAEHPAGFFDLFFIGWFVKILTFCPENSPQHHRR